MTEIKKDLLDILACPKCKQSVRQEEESIICNNNECGLIYPIKDGIPVMLINGASQPKVSQ